MYSVTIVTQLYLFHFVGSRRLLEEGADQQQEEPDDSTSPDWTKAVIFFPLNGRGSSHYLGTVPPSDLPLVQEVGEPEWVALLIGDDAPTLSVSLLSETTKYHTEKEEILVQMTVCVFLWQIFSPGALKNL